MGAREWGLLGLLSLLWGGSFFLNEVALAGGTPPLTLVLLRVGLAAPILLLAVRATGRRMPADRGTWLAFLAMGALNNAVPFGLIAWGQTRIAGGLAAILNATTPLFTALLAHLLTRDERLTPSRVAGVLLGVAGVGVTVGPPALLGGGGAGSLLGQAAVLGAGVCYAGGAVYGRRRFRDTAPLVTATGQICASIPLLLPAALLAAPPWTVPLPASRAWAAIATSALLGTVLAYVLYFRILAAAGASNAALVTLLVPVSAMLLDAAALGRPPEQHHLVGMGLIAAGLAVTDGRVLALLPARFGRRRRRRWRHSRSAGPTRPGRPGRP